ncbi:hypothetical protein IGI46_000411 [Enterococcus sp. AZ163]
MTIKVTYSWFIRKVTAFHYYTNYWKYLITFINKYVVKVFYMQDCDIKE